MIYETTIGNNLVYFAIFKTAIDNNAVCHWLQSDTDKIYDAVSSIVWLLLQDEIFSATGAVIDIQPRKHVLERVSRIASEFLATSMNSDKARPSLTVPVAPPVARPGSSKSSTPTTTPTPVRVARPSTSQYAKKRKISGSALEMDSTPAKVRALFTLLGGRDMSRCWSSQCVLAS